MAAGRAIDVVSNTMRTVILRVNTYLLDQSSTANIFQLRSICIKARIDLSLTVTAIDSSLHGWTFTLNQFGRKISTV